MFMRTLIPFLTVISAIHSSILPRDWCYGGDRISKTCYGSPNGGPQSLAIEDIVNAGAYLRSYGRSTTPPKFLSIPAIGQDNCTFATLYTHGTVAVKLKHFNFTYTTSVLFEDIADAIDGGETPTASSLDRSVLSCGWKGGSIGVTANATRSEYHTPGYVASGAITEGFVVGLINVANQNQPL